MNVKILYSTYCINNLCTLLFAKNINQGNSPLNCYCIYRLHKKVDYVCIVQFFMRNCSINHCLTLYHDGLLRRLYLVVDGVICAQGLACL